MTHARPDARNASFNLDRFYQDLQRVESSLGKDGARKTFNPVRHEPSQAEKAKALGSFKKELHKKELAKTKINLDAPYDHPKPSKQEASEKGQYRFSELSNHEEKEVSAYDHIREKLQRWKKEESVIEKVEERNFALSNINSKVQKSEADESNYYDFLEKTMETPLHEQPETAGSALQKRLLDELSKRNEVYELALRHCRPEKSYYRRAEADLAIKLQENFRDHHIMGKII